MTSGCFFSKQIKNKIDLILKNYNYMLYNMTRLGGMKKELHDLKNEFSTQLSDLSNSLNEKFDSLYKLIGESEGKIKANINDIVTVSLMTNTPGPVHQ